MTKTLTRTNGYKTLVSRIRKELEGLELLIKWETVLRYWRVGKYISEHLLENKERADYGDHFYEDLAQDTGRHKTLLTRAVQFYHAYPIVAPGQQLTWSHYRALLSIEDKSERKRLERLAIDKDWDSKEFAKYIKALKEKEEQSQKPKIIPQLAFIPGSLNSYRLLEPEILPSGQESGILIDLGFRMRRELTESESDSFKPNDFVSIIQKGKTYSFEKIITSLEELFTYKACVQKIIDGDTLWALIDAGFGRLIQQKLRLRGIDCPELSTPQGQRAKRFVQERLKCLDFIIVKTYKDKVDKYDRYLVDLFYSKDETDPQKVLEEGTFLNQELLDKGLAVEA